VAGLALALALLRGGACCAGADSASPLAQVGQRVLAIGNPFGLDHSLSQVGGTPQVAATGHVPPSHSQSPIACCDASPPPPQGVVSGLGRDLPTGGVPIKGMIQTDAAINPGNSGACRHTIHEGNGMRCKLVTGAAGAFGAVSSVRRQPTRLPSPLRAGGVLLDSKGRLVGINTAILDPTGKGTSSGVGFAIPIDPVRGLVDQILTWVVPGAVPWGRALGPCPGVVPGVARPCAVLLLTA
jgi:hypothetical protein